MNAPSVSASASGSAPERASLRAGPGVVALAVALACAPRASAGEPLAVRDQNPLLRGAYLPLPALEAAPGDGWRLATTLQWSNTVNADAGPADSLLVDGEAAELDLIAVRSHGPWRFRAVLPVIRRGAGVLDGFIDSWHRAFGLPKGIRPLRAKNLYDIRYTGADGRSSRADSGTALGDLALEAGRTLQSSADSELVAWLGVEAPTGSRRRYTGNGALDAAAWLSGRIALGPRVTLAGQAGVTAPGGDQPVRYRSAAGFGTLSLGWRVSDGFEALVQLDGHSQLADRTDLTFLRAATLLTLGGRVHFASGTQFEAGVTEDVAVDRSPDVSFYFGLSSRF